MDVEEMIRGYIQSLPEPKRSDVASLHELILALAPNSRLWFLDGRDASGKVVSNPSIGKAEITGYCIKFRSLAKVNLEVLRAAVGDAMRRTRT
ncbi:MAG TPA: hypothetical protein VK019_05010 [Pseudomonas sp.]|nr:hypothetical protein [Pseudomonas sp.]